MKLIINDLGQFVFNLNRHIIDNINNSKNLDISEANKQGVSEFLLTNNYLIFFSYYCDEPVIKTIHFAEGTIIQQITKNYLEYPDLLDLVTKTHYFLIEELLSILPKNQPKKVNKLWLITIVLLIAILIIIVFLINK